MTQVDTSSFNDASIILGHFVKLMVENQNLRFGRPQQVDLMLGKMSSYEVFHPLELVVCSVVGLCTGRVSVCLSLYDPIAP